MHYVQQNDGGHGLSLAINTMSWIAVSVIICIGVMQWDFTQKIKIAKTDIALLAVAVCLFVPFFWSDSPWRETAYGRYFAIIAFVLLTVAFRQFTFTAHQKNVFWGIVVAGILIQCVIGVSQFFGADTVFAIRGQRPQGSFQQVNVFASFIATSLSISVYQLCSAHIKKPLKILHYLMVFFAGLLLVLITSRVGILGSVVALISLCFLFRQHKKQMLTIIVIVISGALAAVALKNINESSFRNSDTLTSDKGRTLIYKVSVELIKDAPLLGYGLGKFQLVYLEKQAEVLASDSTIPLPNAQAQTHPHNELLFWWIEGGVIPVLSLLLFALWLSIRVWRHGTIDHKAAWLCCIPIMLHTQTEYPLYASVPHLALLGLLVAQATPESTKHYKTSLSLLPKIFYGVFVLVCVFMLTNLHTMRLMNQYATTSDAKYLGQIINSFGQQPLINYRQSLEMVLLEAQAFLPAAKELIEYEVKVRPSEAAFWVLYRIQQLMPRTDEEQTAERAKYLFPKSTFFRDK
jgi:O-antigen polymerase